MLEVCHVINNYYKYLRIIRNDKKDLYV